MPLPVLNQAVNVLDATSLLSSFGAVGIAVVMFAETGLLIGFFLPGDSLLFTAGLLSVSGASDVVHLSLWQVLVASLAGALLGAQTGYALGRRGGPALLDAAHWATERPWLDDLAVALRDAFEAGSAPTRTRPPGARARLEVTVSDLVTDAWTLHAPSQTGRTAHPGRSAQAAAETIRATGPVGAAETVRAKEPRS